MSRSHITAAALLVSLAAAVPPSNARQDRRLVQKQLARSTAAVPVFQATDGSEAWKVAASHDGEWVVTGSRAGWGKLWARESGDCLASWRLHSEGTEGLFFRGRSRQLISWTE